MFLIFFLLILIYLFSIITVNKQKITKENCVNLFTFLKYFIIDLIGTISINFKSLFNPTIHSFFIVKLNAPIS